MWVLVVDDDPDVRRVVRRGLERNGCQVAEAADGPTALELIRQISVDVAVLDRDLPGMSGLELLGELRRVNASLHVIMLTGAAAEADRVLGLNSGADDYVVKPFSALELAARVVALRRRHAVGEVAADESGVADHSSEVLATNAEADAIVIEAGGIVASATPAALRLVGAERLDQVVGRQVLSFLAAESAKAARTRYDQAVTSGSTSPALLYLVRLDGRRQLILFASDDTEWEGQKATRLSMWEQTEDAHPGARPAAQLGTEPEAVLILDLDARIRSVNPAAEQMYGWSERELLCDAFGSSIGASMLPSELEAMVAAIKQGEPWKGRVLHRRRDGGSIPVNTSSTVLRHRSGGPVSVMVVSQAQPSVNAGVEGSTDLIAEMRRGISQGEFVVFYQPVIRLKDASVLGMEALVRWQHPTRGLLPPSAFIELAERSDVIIELGASVLRQAHSQWALWRDKGLTLSMSVNLSGKQLVDPDLPALIASLRFPEGHLWLEVTESALVQDLDQAGRRLTEVTALGAKISIDDFGTGWASMTYLREFPVHALKIDRTFTDGVGTSKMDTAITNSVLSLGRELGLKVVAEGIETRGQHAKLLDLGCELGQGFLFGRPRPPQELTWR